MRLTYTGSRHGMSDEQHDQWREFLTANRISVWHFGGCIGGDREAFDAWVGFGSGVAHCWPARVPPRLQALPTAGEIAAYGIVMHEPMPPLVRNRLMVDVSDVVFAAPHATKASNGTRSTMRYANTTGRRLVVAS